MDHIYLDLESFYDSENDYTLKKKGKDSLSLVEYVRDPRFKLFGIGYADGEENPIWVGIEQFKKNFPNPKALTLVSHNIKFDGFVLRELFGMEFGQYRDTLGMSRAVLGKTIKSHSLKALAEHFQFQPKGELKIDGLQELTKAQEEELSEYCLHDVRLCRDIYKKLGKDFPENQYATLDQTIRMFVVPKLQLNVPLLEKANEDETKRREDIFKEIGIEKAVFASNDKFPQLLKSKGYKTPTKPSPKKKNADGTPKLIPALSLNDTEFLELKENGDEELKRLCEARIAAKSTLLETRTGKLSRIGKTGAWPFDVQFSGAEQTHRFSGGNGAGGNPQNFSRDSALRDGVEAANGYSLVVGDFSNVELRLVAYLSKDKTLIKALEDGIDLYADFASDYYGRKITKEDKAERKYGKTGMLSFQYGSGWIKFINTVKKETGQKIEKDESIRTVNLYRNKYSGVKALWDFLDEHIEMLTLDNPQGALAGKWDLPIKLIHEGFVLPSGLAVRYPNLRREQAINDRGEMRLEWVYDVFSKGKLIKPKLYGGKWTENICQSLAGELTKLAMEEMGDCVVGQNHDEILVVCRKGQELVTKQKLYKAMTKSPSWLPQIKLEAEIGWGRSWSDAK